MVAQRLGYHIQGARTYVADNILAVWPCMRSCRLRKVENRYNLDFLVQASFSRDFFADHKAHTNQRWYQARRTKRWTQICTRQGKLPGTLRPFQGFRRKGLFEEKQTPGNLSLLLLADPPVHTSLVRLGAISSSNRKYYIVNYFKSIYIKSRTRNERNADVYLSVFTVRLYEVSCITDSPG